MAVIIGGAGNGSGDKYPKSGVREAFVGDGNRRDDRCVSRSAAVGGGSQ